MSYKLYSRLVGKISTGAEAIGLNAPADTTTPFNEQTPGTKFMAYGEDATSLAFNRALGALSVNIDSLADVFNTPALRSEMLRPGSSGFPALLIDDHFQTDIKLGDDVVGGNAPVWIYCGLTPEALQRSTRIFNVAGEVDGEDSHKSDLVNDQGFTNFNLAPVTCYANQADQTASIKFHGKSDGSDQVFIGPSDSGIPLTVPPVSRIKSDLLPYSGEEREIIINSWEPDGLYLRTMKPDQLSLRPGCFVEVKNNGDPDGNIGNNGLFRIESISQNDDIAASSEGSKLVLSRGNLHKVTVSGDVFSSGELVSWQSKPDETEDSLANPEKRTNFAHIMYMVDRPDLGGGYVDLYLSNTSGPNNFLPSVGSSNPKLGSSSSINAISNYGSVGLADQEEGADQNWSLPIGTLLYNAKATEDHLDAGASSGVVEAVIPAGYPIVFSTINTPGQLYPCTPPGFLLNPILEFSENLLAGNNYLWTKTLTTVGEQLRSKSDGYNSLASEDASNEPFQTRQDVIATEVLLSHIHHGSKPADSNTALNGPKSPTSSILGPSLWQLVLEDTETGGPVTLEDAYSDGGFTLGEDYLYCVGIGRMGNFFIKPLSWTRDSEAPYTYTVICTDVTPIHEYNLDIESWTPVEGTVVFTGADRYKITEVRKAPGLRHTGHDETHSPDHEFLMSYGLNAAFHAHNSSSELLRGGYSGAGNIIYVPGGNRAPNGELSASKAHRPFTTVLEGLSPWEIGHLVSSDEEQVSLIELYTKESNEVIAGVRHDSDDPDKNIGHLEFGDRNTLNTSADHGGDDWVHFSSRHSNRIYTDDVAGTMPYTHHGSRLPSEVFDQTILGAIEAGISGNYSDYEFGQALEFGSFSNGVMWGAEVYFYRDHDTAGTHQTPLMDQDEMGHWVSDDSRISITPGYFNIGGAKNYVDAYSIDLVDFNDQYVMVYYDINLRTYKTIAENRIEAINLNTIDRYIPIAFVKVSDAADSAVSEVIDIRQRVCKADQRDEIYVGEIGTVPDAEEKRWTPGMFEQGGMHFSTLGAAIAAIEVWTTCMRHERGRNWSIKVVGNTFEIGDRFRGINYPIKIPCDSLTIEGLGARGTAGDKNANDEHGVKAPRITVKDYVSLFDLNGRSNLTFSNLSIVFAHGDALWENRSQAINVFENNQDGWKYIEDRDYVEWRDPDDVDHGTGAIYGRWGDYAPYYPMAKPLQENIMIDRVHVKGDHHSFFFHGRADTGGGNASTGEEIPFDNLTIQHCSSHDGLFGFIQICPSNSLDSLTFGDLKGYTKAAATDAYYWRNINIIDCTAVGSAGWNHTVADPEYSIQSMQENLFLDGVHLAACKEVTIRDCHFSEYLRGIVFGVGNWTHYSTGVIENNIVRDVYGDGICAYSESETSGIKIIGNRITDWGLYWEEKNGGGFEADHETWYRQLHNRYDRFAAIRVAANDILIQSNILDDGGYRVKRGQDTVAVPYTMVPVGVGFQWRVTQGIHISKDLYGDGADAGLHNAHWGVQIKDNVHTCFGQGGCFIYSNVEFLCESTISGNTYSSSAELPFSTSYTHPVFWRAAWGAESDHSDWVEHSEDMRGLDLGAVQDSIISDNNLQGHVLIWNVNGVNVTGNRFRFPSTFIEIVGGQSLTFNSNQLHNGTLMYHGETATISDNNFNSSGLGADSPSFDLYGYPHSWIAGDGIETIWPGLYMYLSDASLSFETQAVITGNTLGPNVSNVIEPSGAPATTTPIKCVAYIGGPDGAIIHFANNIMLNPEIVLDGTVAFNISGNSLISYATTIGDELPLVLDIINSTDLWDGMFSHGRSDHRFTIAGNSIVGNVRINGAAGGAYYESFNSWNRLAEAYGTGIVQSSISGDDVGWGEHAFLSDGITVPRAWEHNKLGNLNVNDNTIKGNVELIGIQDSNFTNNRLQGSFDKSLALTGVEGTLDYLSSSVYQDIDLFTTGQVALLGCSRMNISNCKLASLYIMYSKSISATNCAFGHTEGFYDRYGSGHLYSSATYQATNQGRVFAMYSPHISLSNCRIKDATIDRPPRQQDAPLLSDFSEVPETIPMSDAYLNQEGYGNAYMNDPFRAVYSSMGTEYFADGITSTWEERPSTGTLAVSDTYVVDVIAQACPAFSIKDCHLGRAHLMASDDAMIMNNRFYYGGDHPKYRKNLVIYESSLRPSVQGNHFTASVVIGDVNEWEKKYADATGGENYHMWDEWTFQVEKVVRHPVHAQVVGNRFDSAVGAHFDSWERSPGDLYGMRYGSGDLTIHNYGGSLISNNHMMKSPFGYMMHAASTVTKDGSNHEADWKVALGITISEEDALSYAAWKRERKDLDNRIGGCIKLDPFNSYNEWMYTWGHILTGQMRLEDGFYTNLKNDRSGASMYDSRRDHAYHYVRIGMGVNRPVDYSLTEPTGGNNILTNYPLTQLADAIDWDSPKCWHERWSFQETLDDPDEHDPLPVQTSKIAIPWGGTYVMNFFANSHRIMSKAFIQLPRAGGNWHTVRTEEHFPKTMGCFVVSNICKRIEMSDFVRQSSWAYGRYCDIRVDREQSAIGDSAEQIDTDDDTLHLPAQAFETPLNPMHANNHTQFNMVRYKDEWLDLAVTGNFGSYIVRSNPDLDESYGRQSHKALEDERIYNKWNHYGIKKWNQISIMSPDRPHDSYLFGQGPEEMCDPWAATFFDPGGGTGETTGTTSCVLGGTLIETSRGRVPVEEIRGGDSVKSYDFEAEEFGYYDVITVMEPVERDRWVRVTTETGRELRCTLDHPLYTLTVEGNELPIHDAVVGTTVYVLDGDDLIDDVVSGIEVIEESVMVYNFEVGGVHSYISDEILSHNKVTDGGTGGTVTYPPTGPSGGTGGGVIVFDDDDWWEDGPGTAEDEDETGSSGDVTTDTEPHEDHGNPPTVP